MEHNKTKWRFLKELKIMAVSCTKVKESTATKKALKIFNEFEELIHDSYYHRNYYKEKYHIENKKFETLKNGKINYSNGSILLSEICQVEVNNIGVIIFTKSGREINLSLDFSYLKDII
jgi:hypothetical protein